MLALPPRNSNVSKFLEVKLGPCIPQDSSRKNCRNRHLARLSLTVRHWLVTLESCDPWCEQVNSKKSPHPKDTTPINKPVVLDPTASFPDGAFYSFSSLVFLTPIPPAPPTGLDSESRALAAEATRRHCQGAARALRSPHGPHPQIRHTHPGPHWNDCRGAQPNWSMVVMRESTYNQLTYARAIHPHRRLLTTLAAPEQVWQSLSNLDRVTGQGTQKFFKIRQTEECEIEIPVHQIR